MQIFCSGVFRLMVGIIHLSLAPLVTYSFILQIQATTTPYQFLGALVSVFGA